MTIAVDLGRKAAKNKQTNKLIWVQTVGKSYQQTTLKDIEVRNREERPACEHRKDKHSGV